MPAAYALSIGRPRTLTAEVVNTTPLPSASSGASVCAVNYGPLALMVSGWPYDSSLIASMTDALKRRSVPDLTARVAA